MHCTKKFCCVLVSTTLGEKFSSRFDFALRQSVTTKTDILHPLEKIFLLAAVVVYASALIFQFLLMPSVLVDRLPWFEHWGVLLAVLFGMLNIHGWKAVADALLSKGRANNSEQVCGVESSNSQTPLTRILLFRALSPLFLVLFFVALKGWLLMPFLLGFTAFLIVGMVLALLLPAAGYSLASSKQGTE